MPESRGGGGGGPIWGMPESKHFFYGRSSLIQGDKHMGWEGHLEAVMGLKDDNQILDTQNRTKNTKASKEAELQ